MERVPSALILEFQSTLPLRGATFSMRLVQHIVSISIHTPLAGSDVVDVRHVYPVLISIHTPLAGSDDALPQLVDCLQISIHTPLAGSDMPLFFLPLVVSYFNPHSPCGERRSSGSLGFGYRSKFQSTLPLRGATRGLRRAVHRACHFNPHSPCGERRPYTSSPKYSLLFQSTLPLRGATRPASKRYSANSNFNPHSPCGERPEQVKIEAQRFISIHTPLAGSDRRNETFLTK